MDNREAKFVLNAYRPGGQDASDPRFADALEQARRDPVLEHWFNESIEFDTAMTGKLCAIAVPPDLRENILAGAKVSRPLRWSKPFVNWAIAAALISMAILGSLIWQETRPRHLAGKSPALTRNRMTRESFSLGCGQIMRQPQKSCRQIWGDSKASAAEHFPGAANRSP